LIRKSQIQRRYPDRWEDYSTLEIEAQIWDPCCAGCEFLISLCNPLLFTLQSSLLQGGMPLVSMNLATAKFEEAREIREMNAPTDRVKVYFHKDPSRCLLIPEVYPCC